MLRNNVYFERLQNLQFFLSLLQKVNHCEFVQECCNMKKKKSGLELALKIFYTPKVNLKRTFIIVFRHFKQQLLYMIEILECLTVVCINGCSFNWLVIYRRNLKMSIVYKKTKPQCLVIQIQRKRLCELSEIRFFSVLLKINENIHYLVQISFLYMCVYGGELKSYLKKGFLLKVLCLDRFWEVG